MKNQAQRTMTAKKTLRRQQKYRMYVDESGTNSYSKSQAVNQRFLALVGVVVSNDQIASQLQPGIHELKSIITDDPDDLPTLHGQDIANRTDAFSVLGDKRVEERWNQAVAQLIAGLEFIFFTVVIDKQTLLDRYNTPMPPYHYCFSILMEHFVDFLLTHNSRGDVMIEGRGRREDTQLVQEYRGIHLAGSARLDPESFSRTLTSKTPKVRTKDRGIAGLELADLIALAAKLDVLRANGVIDRINSKFTRNLIELLKTKHYTQPSASSPFENSQQFIS